MSAPLHDPEERWRRTVEQRGRPLKLKIGRLLREFGHHELDVAGVRDEVEARLAEVGIVVRPPLRDASADEVITLELVAPEILPPPAGRPPVASLPPAPERGFVVTPAPRAGPPPGQPAPIGRVENTPLVRAAVEAERRARSAYDQAAAAAEDRIARLERELAQEREAIARTRDERDQLEQKMHVERRQAAARLQALAAAERTALRLLEAERAELTSRSQLEPQSRPFAEPAPPRPRDGEPAPPRALPPEPAQEVLPPPGPREELDLTRAPAEAAPRRRGRPQRELPARRRGGGRNATFKPAPAWTPPQPDRGRRIARHVLAPLVLLALGATGFMLGRDDEPATAPASTPLTERASRGGVELTHPSGWVTRTAAPELPGLSFTRPLVLSPSAQSASTIVAGVVRDAVGSDLLPAALRKRLPASAPDGEPVLLGDTQALRYAGLQVEGLDGALTLFAVPTTRGSAVVACRGAESGERLDVCERTAATLNIDGLAVAQLDGKRALALAPSPAYGKRVAAAISALEVALTIDGDRLRKAGTAASQARIARAIAQTFERAGDGLPGPVSARDREGHAGLTSAIGAGAEAYERLASAAQAGDAAAYASATDAALAADGRLRDAIAALQTLGYTT